MYAVNTERGVGEIVGLRMIEQGDDLVSGETFEIANIPEDYFDGEGQPTYVLAPDGKSLEKA